MKDELFTCGTIMINLINITLNERSQTQKSTYYKILFTLYVKTDKMDLLCLKTKQ